jgi:hypothetical protein
MQEEAANDGVAKVVTTMEIDHQGGGLQHQGKVDFFIEKLAHQRRVYDGSGIL